MSTGARVGFDVERVLAGPFSGIAQTIGSAITKNPVIIVFDNQSTVSVALSVDGTNTFKTLVSGEAFVLDLRANIGKAPNYTVDLGTQFFGTGTGGTGNMTVAIFYSF
jgi:hypothetical protein